MSLRWLLYSVGGDWKVRRDRNDTTSGRVVDVMRIRRNVLMLLMTMKLGMELLLMELLRLYRRQLVSRGIDDWNRDAIAGIGRDWALSFWFSATHISRS